jgi:hypothetical protein
MGYGHHEGDNPSTLFGNNNFFLLAPLKNIQAKPTKLLDLIVKYYYNNTLVETLISFQTSFKGENYENNRR